MNNPHIKFFEKPKAVPYSTFLLTLVDKFGMWSDKAETYRCTLWNIQMSPAWSFQISETLRGSTVNIREHFHSKSSFLVQKYLCKLHVFPIFFLHKLQPGTWNFKDQKSSKCRISVTCVKKSNIKINQNEYLERH